MNYNTIVTPEEGLPCSKKEADAITILLEEEDPADDCESSGFQFVFEPPAFGVGRRGMGYLEAEEYGTWDALPDAVLRRIGKLIARAGKPYLECGVAFTGSRMRVGSHGGTAFRIYADGSIVNRIESWPEAVR